MFLYKEKKNVIITDIIIFNIYIALSFIMSYTLTRNFSTTLFYTLIMLATISFAKMAEIFNNLNNRVLFNFFLLCSFLILFFIYGFRNFSAVDDLSYIRIFNQINRIGFIEYFKYSTMEPGYLILNSFVLLFTENYLYVQLLTAFIPLFFFFYGFRQYKDIISLPLAVFLLSTMLYFQMLSIGLVRMFIAVSIIFVILIYVPEQKTIKFIFGVLLASMFHYSALIMLVLVYFSLDSTRILNKSKSVYLILLVLTPLIFILISKFIVPLLGARYQGYANVENISISLTTFSTLPIIIILLYFLKYFKDNEKDFYVIFLFIYALSLIISLSSSLVSLGRIVYFSYSSLILAASMISKKINSSYKLLLFQIIILLYGFLYLFYTQFLNPQNSLHLYPYFNIFFEI